MKARITFTAGFSHNGRKYDIDNEWLGLPYKTASATVPSLVTALSRADRLADGNMDR